MTVDSCEPTEVVAEVRHEHLGRHLVRVIARRLRFFRHAEAADPELRIAGVRKALSPEIVIGPEPAAALFRIVLLTKPVPVVPSTARHSSLYVAYHDGRKAGFDQLLRRHTSAIMRRTDRSEVVRNAAARAASARSAVV